MTKNPSTNRIGLESELLDLIDTSTSENFTEILDFLNQESYVKQEKHSVESFILRGIG